MALTRFFRLKRRRKYPIRRDETGRSARNRCFEMFAAKVPVPEIAKKLDIKVDTVRRYRRQWLQHPGLEIQHAYARSLFTQTNPERDTNLAFFAGIWGLTTEELETILAQPHGLRRLMTGKIYVPANAAADHKRHVALELACLMAEHLAGKTGKFEDVYLALRRYLREYARYRQDTDADIAEENKTMELVRAIIAADLENERLGRVKPISLSQAERDVLVKWGIEKAQQETEIVYWLRIGSLMAGGLTKEQAREQIYQDLLQQGNLKEAELLRELQNKVHPLPTTAQEAPPASPPPPSPA